MPGRGRTVRVEFSEKHDDFLVKYLATYCPSKEGRSGRKIFQNLIDNKDKRWPWSVHHTWQSWRERYVKNSAHFDARILKYQRKHNIQSVDKRKRASEPMPTDTPRPSAKRVKLEKEEEEEEEESTQSGETVAATQHEDAGPSRPKPTPKPTPKRPDEPPETPSRPHNEPEPTNVRRTAPETSPQRSNASASATKKPNSDTQRQPETLEISSSSPDRQVPRSVNGNHEPPSPPRHVKRIKVRLSTPSDIFVSEPSSPGRDALPVLSAASSPSHARSVPPAMGTSADNAPVAATIHPRAPPRIVDSFHGQVLVDREGHVHRALPREEEDGAEVEELAVVEDKAQWPPARRRTTEQQRPNAEVNIHHAFSQPQPNPPPFNGPQLDRRTIAALFSGQARQGVGSRVESEQREHTVRNGASPVKRVVTTAPPSDPFSGVIPKPLSKVLKFPVPRASTRSPFRPELPTKETHHPSPSPQPQSRPSSRTRATRHLALTRVRRRTIDHGRKSANGNRDERRQQRGHVPSVDLVAHARSSLSGRSHSRSSADTLLPARPSRWSLPAFAHAAPWVLDDPQGQSFRWAAPSPVYDDMWGRQRTRTSSLVGTSTPRFMLTPSPAQSITGADGTITSTTPLTLRPPELHLTFRHGLASILAHMSANHGLALSVVEAVFERLGSLREADDVLRKMREAAERLGEQEIEKRLKARRDERRDSGRKDINGSGRGEDGQEWGKDEGRMAQLRYVVASEDGEGSEYSPPETSRAAMWKRQSESASYGEEEGGGEEDEEAEEGRAVEEELRDRDEDEDEDGGDGIHHDFSRRVHEVTGQEDEENEDRTRDVPEPKEDAWEEQSVTAALLEDTRFAQELERKLGKGRLRRDIARLFNA